MPTTKQTTSTGIYTTTKTSTRIDLADKAQRREWLEAGRAWIGKATNIYNFSPANFVGTLAAHESDLLKIQEECGCNPKNATMLARSTNALKVVQEVRAAVDAGNAIAAALLALSLGRRLEMVNVTPFEPEVVIGGKIRLGGRKGAASHNRDAGLIASDVAKAKKLFYELYTQPKRDGEDPKKTLVMWKIAKAIRKSVRTVATYLSQ